MTFLQMTIGFFCKANPFEDKRAWSGTIYKLRESIEQAGFKVIWIKTGKYEFVLKYFYYAAKIFFPKYYIPIEHTPLASWVLSLGINNSLCKKCDFYFFPGRAHIIKHIKYKRDTIYLSDTCFCDMINYYWGDVPEKFIRWGNKLEEYSIRASSINIRSSKWAADSAIRNFGSNPENTHVIQFGANIDSHLETTVQYPSSELHILFSGIDWNRKGGPIAVETVRILNEKGIKATLTMVGIQKIPEDVTNLPYVTNIGFLNKNDENQYKRYINIWINSHIFLLPTKAECSATVFCEASSFGVPAITYDTGGLGSYVFDGINGYKLPLSSTARDFANCIADIVESGQIKNLSEGSKKLYATTLSWSVWSRKFKEIIQNYTAVTCEEEGMSEGAALRNPRVATEQIPERRDLQIYD